MPPPAAASTSSIDDASLQSFWRLPQELQQRILSFACRAPASSDQELNKRFTLALDLATTRSLALVSRQLYPQIVTLLYRSPKITTISALRSFQYALSSRPALGRLVKDLHIGPADDLPRHWWPLSPERVQGAEAQGLPLVRLATSLDEVDEDVRPRWCQPRHNWSSLQLIFPSACCHDRAALRALESAFTALDVDPETPHLDQSSGERIGRDTWAIRIFEAQAALDLFLMAMRKIEDARGYPVPTWHTSTPTPPVEACHDQLCDHYPTLIVEPTPAAVLPNWAATYSPPRDTDNTIQLTRAQLHAHLARPGSLTDRFDHPLLLARSGVLMFDRYHATGANLYDEGRDSTYELQHFPTDPPSSSDYADIFAISDAGLHVEEDIGPRDSTSALDPAISNAATLGSMLALARSVLSFTPTLTNLSLTSFLPRAVCGSRPPPALKALRYLSVGPHLPHCDATLYLNSTAIASVEKLRLCDFSLGEGEAASIAGEGGALPQLKELHFIVSKSDGWYFQEGRREATQLGEGGYSLFQLFAHLSRSAPLFKRGNPPSQKRKRKLDDDAEGSEIAASPGIRSSSLYIDARLIPKEVHLVLNQAPSASALQAWSDGRLLPEWSHHRFRVVELPQEIWKKPEEYTEPPRVPQGLYDEGQEWWKERAEESGSVKA